ncbi:uncharacterized protein BDW47DRAFT_131248 [Aspergillus candidus]|uniref:Zn(2)-C6 fungal-type domain-containing protein n=1 Tax=Aspergillus candidus TaxID=41067 RepID=A0A2I2FDA0_ASPCN|nr:hypothetical protein BDW47DRAFT_131248 [Aspergillus candidus]PLB38625.1 hypothetical protein BDW47DRAFT_131248 [Aspergillus candidus]
MSDSSSSTRLLAPAPGQPQKPNASADDVVPGRKHKTTACRACKLKKLKCRGDPPCEHCVANRIECVVDEMADMRRKFAMKRKLDRLEQAEDILTQLIKALRDSENKRLSQLLNLIRSNASLEELQIFLQHQFSRAEIERSPELREIQLKIQRSSTESSSEEGFTTGRQQRPPRRMLELRRLVDIPVHRVPAKPWTTATADDDLVSHLVSLWLTWTFPFFHWLNADVFVRAMQSGDVNSPFCSPFLVNSILAEASYYSDYADVFTVPDDMLSRGDQFFEEARRLLDVGDNPSPSLATIQGLLIFFVRMVLMGKDRMGWMYLDLATRSAEDYAATHPPRPPQSEAERVTQDVASRTLWGIFSFGSTAAVSLMKHIDVKPPSCPRVSISHGDACDVWVPYPRSADRVTGHHNCVFDRWCDLCCITIQISRAFHDNSDRPPQADLVAIVEDVYRQLQGWHANLPDCLGVDTAAVPHILSLHLFYHTTVIQIFGFLRSNIDTTLDPGAGERARNIGMSTARRIAYLLGLHRERWGIDRMAPSTIQWISVSLFTLLEGLDQPENRNPFVEVLVLGRAFARRFALATGIMRMIQLSAEQMQVALPEETHALFVDFQTQTWGDRDANGFSSFYPHFLTVVQQPEARQTEASMDNFLGKWDNLNLKEKDRDESHDH